MAPDLFRRWLDMLFWWLPSSGSANQDSATGHNAEKQAPSKQATSTQSRPTSQPTGGGSAASATVQTDGGSTEADTTGAPSKDRAADDLTAIKGIGPAMAGRLRDMGIETFDDLAGTNIKEITRRLREQSVVISEKKVEGWVQAARAQR